MRKSPCTLHLPQSLRYTDNSFTNLNADKSYVDYQSKYLMDTKASFYNLYVYSDLVAETLVRNTYVPLLQTVLASESSIGRANS